MLKPSELVSCILELHIQVTPEDLERPQPTRIMAIFEAFTDILMGISRDQFSQPNFATMEMLEYPDLHQDSICLMAFYRQLYKLVSELGITDFCIRDLIKPEPGRIRRIFSAIINFVKFREDKLNVYTELALETNGYKEERQVLEERNRELADQVNTIRLKRAEEEPEYQKRKEINHGLTTELRELKRIQTSLTSEIDALKKQKTELTDKLANTNFLVMNCKQDCARLRGRIVHSPEKLQQAVVDMTQSLQSEKATLASVGKRCNDLYAKLDTMEEADAELLACLKLMEECDAAIKKSSSAGGKVSFEKENIEKKRQEMGDIEIKEQHLTRQLTNVSEKIERLKRQQEMKRQAGSERMAKSQSEYEAISKERDYNQAIIEAHEAKTQELELKIAELKKKLELEVTALRNDFHSLKGKSEKYMATLGK
ncbi:kinetochore-associated Ndc80 complex subunit nuf2, partial [Blyttiomyces sp. JEL0837]